MKPETKFQVLIAYASKYGSTKEIAEHIALVLEQRGLSADVKDAETVSSLQPYQAVVIGSALYFDNWLPSASELLESFQEELAHKPVWLFSSGITGNGHLSKTYNRSFPKSLSSLVETIKPKAVAFFGGRVNADNLELNDWLINPGMRFSGDYRNWQDIERWSDSIADTLYTLKIFKVKRNEITTRQKLYKRQSLLRIKKMTKDKKPNLIKTTAKVNQLKYAIFFNFV